jgi:DNA ligase (NAD+)
VFISGSTVSRATLHNYEEIERLGLKIGDKVLIKKAGDIIPQVIKVLEELRSGKEKKIKKVEVCPDCGQKLFQNFDEDGVKITCTNASCPSKVINKIIYFASRKCVNIEGLGESTVENLHALGLANKVSDIYKLTREQILTLPLTKDKTADNLLSAIENSKNILLEKFIMSLSIPNVGEETSIDLAKHFKNLKKFRTATASDFGNFYGIGEKIKDDILNFLKNKENQNEIDELLKYVKVQEYIDTNISQKLSGQNFVITGSFEKYSRPDIEKMIKENGGNALDTVNKKTTYLILGTDPGSKLEKAKKLEVKIISISDFLKLI